MTREEVLAKMIEFAAMAFGKDAADIKEDTDIAAELGVKSSQRVAMAASIENDFDVMIPVALGSLVTNLTSLLDLVTMMRCLGRVQMFHGAELAERFGAFAAQPDFPAFVYGSFTGMAITVFNLVPSVTNMLGKSALPCAAALWAKQDCLGTAAHVRSVTGAAAAMAFPAAGGLWVLAEPVMHLLYAGRPEEAAIAAEALRTLLPGMVCLCLTFPLCSVLQGIGRAGIPEMTVEDTVRARSEPPKGQKAPRK